MEENKPITPPPAPGNKLPADEATAISGGDGTCTTTISVGGVTVTDTSFGGALTQIYDGAVDATSHVIETVANSTR